MPKQLKTALGIQAGITQIDNSSLSSMNDMKSYHINQRNEGIDLENLCSAIAPAAGTRGGNQPVLFDNHGKDCRYNGPLKVAPTVAAVYGTGGNNIPLVSKPIAYSLDSKDSNSMKSGNPISGCRETDKSRTLDTSNTDPSKNQGGIAIVQES